MYTHIYDQLIDIEYRIQIVLEEIRLLKEQVFYTYEGDSHYPEEGNN